jgi:hydroxyacylglutathione hydrolase
MHEGINIINLPMPLKMGNVNCYLLKTRIGYVLIDTGSKNARTMLQEGLIRTGCVPGEIKLIILTHGDFDHIGNAAYLRTAFRTRIAMHQDDSGMAERGDMFVNRKKPNIVIGTLMPIVGGFGKAERFTPDILLEDGYDLSKYGFGARIISLPGHSKGSIGILTSNNELFCGDLFENINKPSLNALMDDSIAAKLSVSKLRELNITKVYPGHGHPFTMSMLEY